MIGMNRKTGRSESDGGFSFEGRSGNSKSRDAGDSDLEIMWPITPIKKHKLDPLFLINEELPEESDDEDYKPCPEELQDQSEEETGRQSVVSTISRTSALDISASQYLENFDSNLLIDSSANQSADDVFKVPDENIGQRTRSKLSLSSTPLEIIEKAFIPPDITTDMYDFKCDNEDWENFLKEFMQPLSNDTNEPDDDDDEADPDYNVLADEEEVDKEELRRDRAVKIPRKELRKLVAELFESPDEYSSDEEEERRVRTEITNRVQSDMKKKAAEKGIKKEEESESNKTILITDTQVLLLEQQLRQHIQFTTQHFIQTYQHPMHGKYAKECKIILCSLLELAKVNDKSTFNAYNLRPAVELIKEWEKYVMSKEGDDVISHMEKEVAASRKAKKKGNFHRVSLHPSMMRRMSESSVFMYPLLLPPLGFRCDGPFKVEFIPPEDTLLALGLDQFTQYIEKNPRWFDKRKNTLRAVVDLLCEYILVAKKPFQVYRHYRNVKNLESNPVNYYCKFKKAPKTMHYVVPFNENLTKAPKDHSRFFLPANFRDFLCESETERRDETRKTKATR